MQDPLSSAYATTPTEPQAPDFATLINSTTACALAGDISPMTLWRWTRDGVIPRPLKIRERKFWNRAEFIAALIAAGSGKSSLPRKIPTKQSKAA